MGAVLGTGRVGILTREALAVVVMVLLLPRHAFAAAFLLELIHFLGTSNSDKIICVAGAAIVLKMCRSI